MNNPIIQMFNKYAMQNKGLVNKALTTAVGVGGALIPENLEQIITDTVIRLSPELAMLEPKDIEGGKTHEFNRLTERPKRGGAMGENATTPFSNSKTTRATVDLKVVRRKGKVTNFLSDTARKYIDAAAYEMQNELQSHVLDVIYYILYGNKDVETLVNSVEDQVPGVEYDGMDKFISTNRTNQSRGGTVPSDLKFLDDMIDASTTKGGARHRRAFGMSPQMLSLVSRLLTNVRLNQGLQGQVSQIDIPGGWRLNAYRDIPIIESTSVRPISKMAAVTLAGEDTAVGSLSNDEYFIQIAPVTYEGEQEASDEQSITLVGGTATQRIRITLPAVHQISSKDAALSYKIYLSLATGTETLLKIVPAFVYDSENAPNGDNGTGTNFIWIDTLTAGIDVPTAMQADVPLVATGGIRPEVIYLWDLDPIQGLGKLPFTNTAGSEFKGLVTTEPLAKTDDFIQFLVKSYLALADSYEATSVWSRGHRVS